MNYGERLDAALKRHKKDKTRAGLAKACGISVQAVGQVIRGESNAMTSENNSKAAAYLECNPDWLATGKGICWVEGRFQNAVNQQPAEWPFAKVDIDKIQNLSRDDLLRLEGMLITLASSIGLDVANELAA